MKYETIAMFGKQKSRGTFDDFYDFKKFVCIEEAWAANEYIKCDFVRDENGIIHIECRDSEEKLPPQYHTLQIQNCPAGIDILDDRLAERMAISMLNPFQP